MIRCSMLLVILVSLAEYGVAQAPWLNDIIDPSQQNVALIYGNSDKFTGSPFYTEEYNIGKLKITTIKEEMSSVKIKYDLINDNILIKDGEKEGVINKMYVANFSIYIPDDEKYHSFVKRSLGGKDHFFETLYGDSNTELLKRHYKVLVKGQEPTGYNSSSLTKDKIVYRSDYYVNRNNSLLKLNNPKKDLIGTLTEDGEIRSSLESFVKKKKLKFKSEEDFIQVMEKLKTLE